MLVFLVFTLVVSQGLLSTAEDNGSPKQWVYKPSQHGLDPAKWKKGYPECSGSSQSPIDIQESDAQTDDSLEGLTLTGWDGKPAALTVTNNGHTVTVAVFGNFTVSGAGLPGEFKLAQFHYHWGSVRTQGSEHTINGKAFPIEQHFVMYNTLYANVSEAVTQPDGLAVIAVMIKLEGFAGPKSKLHRYAYTSMRRRMKCIRIAGSSASIKPRFNMSDILPSKLYPLYRYSGSLTTPGCNEGVTWTVLRNPMSLPRGYVRLFRKLADTHGNRLQDNFRPIQPLNDRNVTTYSKNQAD